MSQTPKFADLDAWNREHPDYFDLPPMERRQGIQPGQFAQIATGDAAHYWLWIEVLERTPYGYRGVVDIAPPADTQCSVGVMDIVDFAARHVHDIYTRRAVGPQPTYLQLLADAQKLDASKYWAPVLAIEDAEIAKRMPPSMRGADGAERLAEYLRRNPHCTSCEHGALAVEAAAAFYLGRPELGDGDDNLIPVCRTAAYAIVARTNNWPMRGCTVDGWPLDPERN